MRLGQAIWAHFPNVMSVGQRVYPRRLPKDAILPALCFQVIPAVGPLKVQSDAHSSGFVEGYHRDRVQWDCWGYTYAQMEDLAEELRQHIHGFAGYWGDLYVAVHTDLDFDSYDQELDHYRRIIDCMVQYNAIVRGS